MKIGYDIDSSLKIAANSFHLQCSNVVIEVFTEK